MKVLLAYGPELRDETGHQLAVALVWNAEAFSELALLFALLLHNRYHRHPGDGFRPPLFLG